MKPPSKPTSSSEMRYESRSNDTDQHYLRQSSSASSFTASAAGFSFLIKSGTGPDECRQSNNVVVGYPVPDQLLRNSFGRLAMPPAIRRATSRVNNLVRDRRPTPSP